MERIRPETEVDRTEQALATVGLTFPLGRGTVQVVVGREAARSRVGQRLLVLFVNEMARMKGVVDRIHVVGLEPNDAVLPSVPLQAERMQAGLTRLVQSLNAPGSPFQAQILFETAKDPAALVGIGGPGTEAPLVAAADAWRALLGRRWVSEAAWDAYAPYGAALAGSCLAAEAFKRIVAANADQAAAGVVLEEFAFSAFNYGVGASAAVGPDILSLALRDFAVVGCGAGGTAALYVLGMQSDLSGKLALVENGRHKLSNLNRYLMTTAADVTDQRHKLASAINHLAIHAPMLRLYAIPRPIEQVPSPSWRLALSTVDNVPARWIIQRRFPNDAVLLDAGVRDLEGVVMRVAPGGRCLECMHPYDPDYEEKERARAWGVDLDTVRVWASDRRPIDDQLLERMASVQARPAVEYKELLGVTFDQVPRLIECGATHLVIDAPGQAAILPIATTHVGALLAAEVAKAHVYPEAALNNWLAHNLRMKPAEPKVKARPPIATCPRTH